ncbi:MAG: chitobiase/beta-hexosaminidase C-terminal domain-containing protein [Rhodothermales bacterium]
MNPTFAQRTLALAVAVTLFAPVRTSQATSPPASSVAPISSPASSPLRWKPSSHVYLAMEALKEIFSDTDVLGDPKQVGSIPIYRVRYKMPADADVFNPSPSDRIIERIGEYELHPDLEEALRLHSQIYLNGVVGPDAYPDIATGQQRVHVEVLRAAYHDVTSDAWLQYLWKVVNEENPGSGASTGERDKYLQKLAFVAGYLTHAAGDMYMHTFINLFAGGPFAFQGTTNGVRHIVAESLVGKRTPSLDVIYNELKDLGLATGNDPYRPAMTATVYDFIYRHMIDAAPGTTLGEDILVDFTPFVDSSDLTLQTSFPRLMSTMKQGLVNDTTWYRTQLDNFEEQIENAPNPVVAGELIAARFAFVTLNEPRVAFAREWIGDIEAGLRAWPEFNWKVMQGLTLSRDGIDTDEITDAVEEYKTDYLLSMLGAPDLAGDILGFIREYEEMIFPEEYREALTDMRDNFVDDYLLSWANLSLEEIRNFYKNPELSFDPIINAPDPTDPDDIAPLLVGLGDYNRDYLYIDDDGYQDPSIRFKPYFFQPAYNTITATKLLMMKPSEITRLQNEVCGAGDCEPVSTNAILGYINSMDFDNEFRLEGGIDGVPVLDPEPSGIMPFGGCSAYTKLFMQQAGEVNPCRLALAAPEIVPADGVFNTPTQVTISHPEPGASVYYAIVDTDNPPAPNAVPFRTYEGPFTLPAPLDGGVRPWLVLARAWKDGFDASPIDSAEITIDSQLASPSFFPTAASHTSFVNVSLSGPTGSTIFYTINGEEPTYNSTAYTGTFQLGIGTHIIRATAYRIGYTQSPVATMTYNVYSADAARAADPVFRYSSFSGFAGEVDVEASSTTQGAQIRIEYAKDQAPSTPTESSTLYTGPFKLGVGNWFIRAIAFSDNLPESNLVQVNYNVNDPLGETLAPELNPAPGDYNNDVIVSITAATNPATTGVRIFYSTDGNAPPTTPVTIGNYTTPFTISTSTTVKAQATRSFFPYSNITTGRYNLIAATPEIVPAGASSTTPVVVTLSTVTNGATIRYTLDGSEPNEGAAVYSGPVTLEESAAMRARAFKPGYTFSESASAAFTIDRPTAPVFLLEPVEQRTTVGSDVTLIAHAIGTPEPSIEWLKDGELIGGSEGDTLLIAGVALTDAGSYQARASNSTASVVSRAALITVDPEPVAPEILLDPVDLEVPLDSLAIFVVEVDGAPSPSLQWQRNGADLSAQTGPSLVFSRASLAMAGEYRVIASNGAGADTSRTALLTVSVSTGLEATGSDAAEFSLGANYPNPFGGRTSIPFSLAEASDVTIDLFDIQGRRLAVLLDRKLPMGSYEADFDAEGLASGVYFYRIRAGEFQAKGKMTVVR